MTAIELLDQLGTTRHVHAVKDASGKVVKCMISPTGEDIPTAAFYAARSSLEEIGEGIWRIDPAKRRPILE